MVFEAPEHRDTTVDLDRQMRFVRNYAAGKLTPYEGSNVIAIARMAIQKAKNAGQDTEEYEKELEALALTAQFLPLRERILKIADTFKNPRIRSRENDIIKEISDIRNQIEIFERDGIDVTKIKELFVNLVDKAKPAE